MSKPSHPLKMTRRESMRLGAGALLALGLWPGCAGVRRAPLASFRFAVVNDTHYMSPECGVWLSDLVTHINSQPGVEFCLIAGDLVENGERAHLGAVADVFGKLRVPFYTEIGNHDYLDADNGANYDAVFPQRRNYVFEHEGWQFIGFDSTEGTKWQNTTIQPAPLAWLRETAARIDPEKPAVLFTHFPLGEGVTYRPANADAALEPFLHHNLQGVFSGHFHGSTATTWNGAPLVTNRCCALKRSNHDGTREKGYFVCTAEAGSVHREFVQFPPV